jgi:voltage-gated potassium channel
MRKRIFKIIEKAEDGDMLSSVYDVFMMVTIILSLLPLTTKSQSPIWSYLDIVTVVIFIMDYGMRWVTADYKLQKNGKSFFLYPFTPMAIIDILSILPSVTMINSGFRVLKIFRLFRTFRVFRVFKTFRYSKNITIILNVFKKQKDSLIVVGTLAIGYIIVSALIVFNVEPDTFPTFFDAIYWATVSLTTVGYGDIYAVSGIGKIITMISALLGIAIVALPAGIVTAGYMDEINRLNDNDD